MSTTEQSESTSSVESTPSKPERKIIDTGGMSSGSCSGFAMPMAVTRSA